MPMRNMTYKINLSLDVRSIRCTGERKVSLHVFLNSVQDENGHVHAPAVLALKERDPGTYCRGPGSGLTTVPSSAISAVHVVA